MSSLLKDEVKDEEHQTRPLMDLKKEAESYDSIYDRFSEKESLFLLMGLVVVAITITLAIALSSSPKSAPPEQAPLEPKTQTPISPTPSSRLAPSGNVAFDGIEMKYQELTTSMKP